MRKKMFSTRPLEFSEFLILNLMVTENKIYKFQPKIYAGVNINIGIYFEKFFVTKSL